MKDRVGIVKGNFPDCRRHNQRTKREQAWKERKKGNQRRGGEKNSLIIPIVRQLNRDENLKTSASCGDRGEKERIGSLLHYFYEPLSILSTSAT